MTPGPLAELQAPLEQALATAGVPGAVLGVLSAGRTTVTAAGLADVPSGRPMTPDSAAAAMSVVKPMVAAVLAGYVAAGTVGWDDPIGAHVPEVAGSAVAAATVDQLVGMTGGLAELPLVVPEGGDSPAALATAIAAAGPAERPGAHFSYSNPAFALLGRLVEMLGDDSWEAVVRQRLLAPLGMDATVPLPEAPTGPVMSEHVTGADGVPAPVPPLDMRAWAGAGTRLRSTAADLLRFAAALLHEPLYTSLREKGAAVPVPYLADAWCRGMARFEWPGGTAYGWDGIGVGVRHALRVLPDSGTAVVLLTNGDRGRLLWRDLLPLAVERISGARVPPLPLTPDPGMGDVSRYAGVYERAGLPPARVTVGPDGVLQVVDVFGPSALQPVRPGLFLVSASEADWPTVSFDLGSDGTPTAYYRAGFRCSRV